MTTHKLVQALLLIASVGGVAVIARADGDHHHGPPPQALDACKAKASGDACSVTFGDRTMDGTCKATRQDATVLACHPAHPPGPPPEAVDACASKAVNDACTVTWGQHTMAGTCSNTDHEGATVALHCRGEHPHHRQ